MSFFSSLLGTLNKKIKEKKKQQQQVLAPLIPEFKKQKKQVKTFSKDIFESFADTSTQQQKEARRSRSPFITPSGKVGAQEALRGTEEFLARETLTGAFLAPKLGIPKEEILFERGGKALSKIQKGEKTTFEEKLDAADWALSLGTGGLAGLVFGGIKSSAKGINKTLKLAKTKAIRDVAEQAFKKGKTADEVTAMIKRLNKVAEDRSGKLAVKEAIQKKGLELPKLPKLKKQIPEELEPLAQEAKKFDTAEDFFNEMPIKVRDELRDKGIKSGEAIKNFWKSNVKQKLPVLDNLNPTGGVFVDYTPQLRMKMKLGKNITTLDKTSKKLPDTIITIYRGAPKIQKEIVGGDFVTTNFDLAKSYTGDGNVISKKVKMSDILDDLESPLGEEYIYRPKEAVKAEPVKVVKPKVKKTKEGKFPTIHEGGVVKMVEGNPIKIVDGVETFLHKDENGNWVVSEATTGRNLSGGGFANSTFAIKEAKSNIDNVGEEKFKKLIEENKLTQTTSEKSKAKAEPVKGLEKNKILKDIVPKKKEPIKIESKVVKKTAETPKIPSKIYEDNRNVKRGLKVTVTKDFKEIKEGVKLGLDRYLGILSTRLKNVNPELKGGLRKFEFKLRQGTLRDTRKATDLLESTKKFSRDDYIDFDLARKNGDEEKIKELVKKYGIQKEYKQTRDLLDDVYKRAEDVGYDIGYLKNYHPRIIKDQKGFINHFKNSKDWGAITQAISAKENALGRYLTEPEKAQMINTLIRGYQLNKISLSETGNMKSRVIDLVDSDINKFYMDSNAALVRYIEQANEAIAARKFFGKTKVGNGTDINDNIGSYILRLMEEGKINPEQEALVAEMLRARFNQVGTRGVVSLYKNLSYVDTMGSPTSAITQIGDLAWALYKSGIPNTVKSFYKSVRGKSIIKRADIGIDNIAAEFSDASKSSELVSKVFKLTGLEKIDAIGKETLINSVISKYQNWARIGDKRLQPVLKKIFGKNTDDVVMALKRGDITEDVKLVAFNELADMQPILLSEMPEKYLTGGNGRIFYMLKTFTLKQFDIYRNEIFQNIAKPGTRLQGLKNLVGLLSFFVIMNATADEIKDFMLNRKTSLKDRTVDNVLRAVGFSKYLTWKARTEGVGSALVRQILPPFKFIDSVSKDILNGIENGSEITQSVPLAGKLYYWWFGKGKYKNERRRKKVSPGKIGLPKLPKLPKIATP